MITLVIGDLQGHLVPLRRLLDRAAFDPANDRLVLVGDIVNRGPDSLGVMRFLRSLGDAVTVTLGNHDIYALARHAGLVDAAPDDTLDPLLDAADAPELFDWLRKQPLLHETSGATIVHAGIPPAWNIDRARAETANASQHLRGPHWIGLLADYFARPKTSWTAHAPADIRAIATIRIVTRIRFVDAAGEAIKGSGPPEDAPRGAIPWFRYPTRATRGVPLVFGHWASLGLWVEGDIAAIDTGYVWGGAMTALRLDDRALFQVLPDRGDRD